jgi:diguanylate cyclase (GGDEF)-like protein
MKHVILLSAGNETPTGALLEALREAGVEAQTHSLKASSVAGQSPEVAGDDAAPPLAVIYEAAAGSEVGEIHAVVMRAADAWPGVPLVACRCDARLQGGRIGVAGTTTGGGRTLDDDALKRLGFSAVADEPAQLSALLRELSDRGTTRDLQLPEASLEIAPASLLLPERLGVRSLRAAFEVVASLHFAGGQKSAASTALAGLASLVHADRWTIYLTGDVSGNAEETSFEPLAVRGLTASERDLPEGDWRRAVLGDALTLSGSESRAARAALVNAETVRKKEGARRVVAVPLVNGERMLGVLEGVREGEGVRGFSASEATLLSALAVPLTSALANSARIAEAERLSLTDDLTKLHNARFLRQYLISEIKRARRYGSTVSAVFLDLDDFKQINDQHGHLVGSHVLMEMAAVILACVRDTDVVTRYGGDEFVVILPETDLERAAHVAERVRERIAGHVFTGGRRSLRLRMTASFGVANFPQHAQSPQQLIAGADTAMYQAKAALKNCICVAPESATNS